MLSFDVASLVGRNKGGGGLAMYRSESSVLSAFGWCSLSFNDASTKAASVRWSLIDSHVNLDVGVADPDICELGRFGMSSSLALLPLMFRSCDLPNVTLVARWMGDSSVGV